MNKNKKRTLLLLIFAILVPFFVTNNAYAVTKSELQNHAASYGYSADLNSLTVDVLDTIDGYGTAYDAARSINPRSKYSKGTYHVFVVSDGAINISRVAGSPGAWINVNSLPKSKTVSSSEQSSTGPSATNATSGKISGNQVTFSENVSVFGTAYDASTGKNAVGTWRGGTYYIFKTSGDAINISRLKNAPGAWIKKPNTVPTPSPEPTNSNSDAVVKDNVIILNKSTKVYTTAADALKGSGSNLTYNAGTYYIFSKSNGAVNISRNEGTPGGWIKTPSQVVNSSNNSSNSNNSNASKPVIVNDKITISNSIKVYRSAEDALRQRNSTLTYPAGTYHVFNKSNGALNISRTAGNPGGWVVIDNYSVNTPVKSTPTPAPVNSNDRNSNTVESVNGNMVAINQSVRVYTTAANAISGVGAVSTWSAGTYYIFNSNSGAVNITRVQGQPGAWIKASVSSEQNNVKSPNNANIVGSSFVLVLDPGHGPGFAHNRGGVLFNEGDQNYSFSKEIEKAASNYRNVTVRNTRSSNNDDPSHAQRAQAGNGADLFISLHTNASAPSVRGTETWGSNSNTKVEFGEDLTKTVASTLNTNNRGQKFDQRNAPITSRPVNGNSDTWKVFQGNNATEKYLIETVFHTNEQDSRAYLNNQTVLARKMMEVIARHFNLAHK